MGKQKHHIVQEKYLAQWKNGPKNHLNIYSIPENKCIEKSTKWKGFFKYDFNIIQDGKEKNYLPEHVTSIIDTKGIEVIRNINFFLKRELSGKERSALAFYIALQYIRTPKHREGTDKMVHAILNYFTKKDISSPSKISLTKDELLKHKPSNKKEKQILEKIKEMSEDKIREEIYQMIQGENVNFRLNKSGHSKSIFKIDQLAKEIFKKKWIFVTPPKNSKFITSDSPCFTISKSKNANGLLSPNSIVIFPLRPDLCIHIQSGIETEQEYYLNLSKSETRTINNLILHNSYECVVAVDKLHLEYLLKNFKYKDHKKSKDVIKSEFGEYIMFNLQ